MNIKKRLILNRILTFVIGILCITAGIMRDVPTLIYMGTVIFFVNIITMARQRKFFSDSEKLKEFENAYSDERLIFIARKSYSFAFWISVYSEFLGVIVTAFMKYEAYSTVLGIIVCFQIFVYAIANMFYSKRY